MSRSRSASRSRSRSPAKRRGTSPPSEENGSPFLIRLFITKGKHTPMIDFDEGKLPFRDEFQAYGWKTSTPSSLIQLLLPSFPAPYRSPLARFSFRHIYVDASPRGLYRHKDLVSFSGRDLLASAASSSTVEKVSMDMELDDEPTASRGGNGGGKKIEEKTLEEYGYITGDLISVSLHVPEPRVSLNVRGAAGAPGRAPFGAGGPGGPGVGGSQGGPGGFGGRDAPPADRDGAWVKGEALSGRGARGRGALDNGYGGPGHRASFDRGDRGERGDRGDRDRDDRGGRAGHGRRSPERNGDGYGRNRSRSGSPRRRESWASRRDRD